VSWSRLPTIPVIIIVLQATGCLVPSEMALLNLPPLIFFWGPDIIFVGLYTNICCNEWFVSLVMFELLVILVSVCIFSRPVFYPAQLNFVHP
jgi:hypothetical protein